MISFRGKEITGIESIHRLTGLPQYIVEEALRFYRDKRSELPELSLTSIFGLRQTIQDLFRMSRGILPDPFYGRVAQLLCRYGVPKEKLSISVSFARTKLKQDFSLEEFESFYFEFLRPLLEAADDEGGDG